LIQRFLERNNLQSWDANRARNRCTERVACKLVAARTLRYGVPALAGTTRHRLKAERHTRVFMDDPEADAAFYFTNITR
jgi:hypothetical protein